jgi:hypothetical protein
MPNTTQSASWDFNPSDPVRLSATFSFDTQDTQDSAPVANRARGHSGATRQRRPGRHTA